MADRVRRRSSNRFLNGRRVVEIPCLMPIEGCTQLATRLWVGTTLLCGGLPALVPFLQDGAEIPLRTEAGHRVDQRCWQRPLERFGRSESPGERRGARPRNGGLSRRRPGGLLRAWRMLLTSSAGGSSSTTTAQLMTCLVCCAVCASLTLMSPRMRPPSYSIFSTTRAAGFVLRQALRCRFSSTSLVLARLSRQ